jgi:hypothetical protein
VVLMSNLYTVVIPYISTARKSEVISKEFSDRFLVTTVYKMINNFIGLIYIQSCRKV